MIENKNKPIHKLAYPSFFIIGILIGVLFTQQFYLENKPTVNLTKDDLILKGSVEIKVNGKTVVDNYNLINRNAYFMIRCKVFNQSDSCTNLIMTYAIAQKSFAQTLALGNSQQTPTSTNDIGCPGDLNTIFPHKNATLTIPSNNIITLSTSWTSASSTTVFNACVLQHTSIGQDNTFSWIAFTPISIAIGDSVSLSWTFNF